MQVIQIDADTNIMSGKYENTESIMIQIDTQITNWVEDEEQLDTEIDLGETLEERLD